MSKTIEPPSLRTPSAPSPAPRTANAPLSSVQSAPKGWRKLLVYTAIARPDHWFKNAFMLLGVILACFYHPEILSLGLFGTLLWSAATTCLLASSNYVINEILDAPTDLSHPVKRFRPIPAGHVNLAVAYFEWVALGVIGLAMAYAVNMPFFFSALFLLVMGLIYNIKPFRSKDLPYVDVLSESVNNPIRLLLGWYAVSQSEVPPLSLLLFYWLIGAFFMASKRFAEYRSIAHVADAGAYRASFRHYDDNRLLVSMFFYATAAALFLGVFIIRYHLELILSIPLIAGFFGWYLQIALKPDSAAQNPERLYREKGLMLYMSGCVAVMVALMFVRLPALYAWFNVEPSYVPALWEF